MASALNGLYDGLEGVGAGAAEQDPHAGTGHDGDKADQHKGPHTHAAVHDGAKLPDEGFTVSHRPGGMRRETAATGWVNPAAHWVPIDTRPSARTSPAPVRSPDGEVERRSVR